MTPTQARRMIVRYSLMTCLIYVSCLIVSPLLLPVNNAEAYSLTQVVFPVFAGYVGTAVMYLQNERDTPSETIDPEMLKMLVYGAFLVFWVLGAVVFSYFFVSNQPWANVQGMRIDELSNYLTMLVSFMNLIVGALIVYLFNVERRAVLETPQQPPPILEKPPVPNV